MTIIEEKVCYDNVRQELKTLWLKRTYKEISTIKYTDALDLIEETLKFSTASDLIELNLLDANISGNIDLRKIIELAEKHGFSSDSDYKGIASLKLKDIKDKRNNLAHGDISFAECGRDLTINDLLEYKDSVVSYLKDVLNNIDEYILNKNYCCI